MQNKCSELPLQSRRQDSFLSLRPTWWGVKLHEFEFGDWIEADLYQMTTNAMNIDKLLVKSILFNFKSIRTLLNILFHKLAKLRRIVLKEIRQVLAVILYFQEKTIFFLKIAWSSRIHFEIRMHSSRMRTARSLTVSCCILRMPPPATMHAPQQPRMPPSNHTCAPATTHPPGTTHVPGNHTHPLATTHPPSNHTSPQQPCMPPGNHTHPLQPRMPPGNHACPLPATTHAPLPATTHAPLPATMHAPLPATMHAPRNYTCPLGNHAHPQATTHAPPGNQL